MSYEELAQKELEGIRERTEKLIVNMQQIATMQKLRMMQEFLQTLGGFERTVLLMAKKEDGDGPKIPGRK